MAGTWRGAVGALAAVGCGLGSFARAGDGNASSRDRDRVLEAVAKAELRANKTIECVIILPRGLVDHSKDGGTGLPTEPLSADLLRRLRRERPRLGTTGSGHCPDPVLCGLTRKWTRRSSARPRWSTRPPDPR